MFWLISSSNLNIIYTDVINSNLELFQSRHENLNVRRILPCKIYEIEDLGFINSLSTHILSARIHSLEEHTSVTFSLKASTTKQIYHEEKNEQMNYEEKKAKASATDKFSSP